MAGSNIITARGKTLDMGALIKNNPDTIAVTGGGRAMNANGDLLGVGGKILKSREDFEKELAEAYDADYPQASKKISIKNPNLQADVTQQTPREEAQAIVEKQIAPKIEAEEDLPAQSFNVEEAASMLVTNPKDINETVEISLEDAAILANPNRKKRATTTDAS